MSKLFLFDRDGTLTKTKSGGDFPEHSADFVIRQEAAFLLGKQIYANPNANFAICSNQAGISLRHSTNRRLGHEMQYVMYLLNKIVGVQAFTKAYWCPDFKGADCYSVALTGGIMGHVCYSGNYRKPNPGMLLQAMKHFDASKEETVFAGDYETDCKAATNAGVAYYDLGCDN